MCPYNSSFRLPLKLSVKMGLPEGLMIPKNKWYKGNHPSLRDPYVMCCATGSMRFATKLTPESPVEQYQRHAKKSCKQVSTNRSFVVVFTKSLYIHIYIYTYQYTCKFIRVLYVYTLCICILICAIHSETGHDTVSSQQPSTNDQKSWCKCPRLTGFHCVPVKFTKTCTCGTTMESDGAPVPPTVRWKPGGNFYNKKLVYPRITHELIHIGHYTHGVLFSFTFTFSYHLFLLGAPL